MKQAVSKTRQQGLTLLELMVVLAIIGILATVGATQFQNYIARARTTAGLNLAAPYKLAIEERLSAGGDKFKQGDLSLPAFAPAQDVKDIKVSDMVSRGKGGIITIIFGERVDGGEKTLTLTPIVSASGVQWVCAAKDVKLKTSEGASTNADFKPGTLEEKFAPANCRG